MIDKEILKNCKKGTVVAFKAIDRDTWFTGEMEWIFEPNSRFNETDNYKFMISGYMIVYPQWSEDGNKTNYYEGEVSNIVILEQQ